ncbi:LysR family transcriptional regulator [Rhodoblastus acidophilus]|uniref:LysR family transcriptional regulator n=1 Tax=Candidatus Rhodoblastus alkanivorans TaxID=2954117 RepID=A0ABS9ZAM1_9HYPH|nr:LysR family transcriptional regulator [Candidatus Rhodoblastus alkanivorans]MCI4677753.1 LysR family transcriptional regulator [Candidatus Rhodoblastus alkanivorans]MCI4684749.1 LysR family transcriptional regulator [Candidatus Rhodoblastus alkanivorans]MDI4642072.1 LysR family transcriptional regulator [Rhodoblastus acidophilus]
MRKIDDLLVFVRVVESGSFIGAARRLGLPPATVSRKIQELEARLQMPLLRRTTRRLSMTEAGAEVFAAASRGVAALEEAEAIVLARRETPSGLLRVAAPYAFGLLRLEPIIRAFQAAFPLIRLEIALTNEPIDLTNYDFDVAFRAGPIADSPYVARPFFTGRSIVVAAPDCIARDGLPPSPHDLAGRNIAILTGPVFLGCPSLAASSVLRFLRGGDIAELTFSPSLASNEPMLLLAHALASVGPAVLYEGLCQEHIEKGDLVVLLDDWRLEATLELSLIYERRSPTDPKIRAFIDFVIESARHRKGFVGAKPP